MHCSQHKCYFVFGLIVLLSVVCFSNCSTSFDIIIDFRKCTSIVFHSIQWKQWNVCVYAISVQNHIQNSIIWTILQSIDVLTLHWQKCTVFKSTVQLQLKKLKLKMNINKLSGRTDVIFGKIFGMIFQN